LLWCRRSPVGRTATICCGAGEGLLAGEPQFVVEQEKSCWQDSHNLLWSRRRPVSRTATVCCGTGEVLLAGQPQFVVEQEKSCWQDSHSLLWSRRSPVSRTATISCGIHGPGAGEGLLAGQPQFVVVHTDQEQEKSCWQDSHNLLWYTRTRSRRRPVGRTATVCCGAGEVLLAGQPQFVVVHSDQEQEKACWQDSHSLLWYTRTRSRRRPVGRRATVCCGTHGPPELRVVARSRNCRCSVAIFRSRRCSGKC
jgi:hypothetical protein